MQTIKENLTKEFIVDLVSNPFVGADESPAKYLPHTYRITDRQLQKIMEYKISIRIQQMKDEDKHHLPR